MPAFMRSCSTLKQKTQWKRPCEVAYKLDTSDKISVRNFFQHFFTPYQLINDRGSKIGLVTAYYEPLLKGARNRGGLYQTPIYQAPSDLLTINLGGIYPVLKNLPLRGRLVGNKILPYPDRSELEKSNILDGNEIFWLESPIDAFFLQIQGSGRIQLNNNTTVRVAYANQNGHPYKSIGQYLISKGELKLSKASLQGIKHWLLINPSRQAELLNINPSYVFFKEESIGDPNSGPKGAQGVPLTPLRSIAVDPQFIQLGTPVFLSTTYPSKNTPLQKLVIAQDTGGAIKGKIRADLFWGFGSKAGAKASKMKQRGMMWLLLPKSYIGEN